MTMCLMIVPLLSPVLGVNFNFWGLDNNELFYFLQRLFYLGPFFVHQKNESGSKLYEMARNSVGNKHFENVEVHCKQVGPTTIVLDTNTSPNKKNIKNLMC